MNRSLLLVICDFLLLSLLALANFDDGFKDEGEAARTNEVEEVVEAESERSDEDLLEALKISLEDERASREELSGDLDMTQQELREREEMLAEREERLAEMAADLDSREEDRERLERERASLEEQVVETREEMETLARERASQEEEARRARELALEMERELREKLEQLDESQQTLARLEERQKEAEEANRRLSTELELSESEKRLIRENLEEVRSEVAVVREEKARVEEQARELAHGVTSLAESSGEIAEEVRRSQPQTANTVFREFQNNRLNADFRASRTLFLGQDDRSRQTHSILVTDGQSVYALFHIEKTGIGLREAAEWERIAGRLSASGENAPIREISFLSIDPRVVVVPVDRTTAESFGTRIYEIAREPLKFPEAVLIDTGAEYYGESTFTLSADHRRYVRMQRKIISRLFGEFSPSGGDLVFSKSNELIGVMVNSEFCALIDNFLPAASLEFGSQLSGVGETLDEMKKRVDRLPARMR